MDEGEGKTRECVRFPKLMGIRQGVSLGEPVQANKGSHTGIHRAWPLETSPLPGRVAAPCDQADFKSRSKLGNPD